MSRAAKEAAQGSPLSDLGFVGPLRVQPGVWVKRLRVSGFRVLGVQRRGVLGILRVWALKLGGWDLSTIGVGRVRVQGHPKMINEPSASRADVRYFSI